MRSWWRRFRTDRATPAYLTNRINELGQMLDELAQANELVHQGVEGEHVLRYAIRSGIQDTQYAGDDFSFWRLRDLNLDREFSIARLKQTLEAYLQFSGSPGHDFLRYVMSALEDAQRDLDRNEEYKTEWQAGLAMLPYVEDGFEKEGYEAGNPEHENDPDYIAAKKLVAGYRLKAKVFARIVPLEADLRVKMGTIQRMKNHYGGADKYRPEHGEVETLYHATAFVPEILRDGFLAEKPADRKGVGNFGDQALISFTHDLEISRNIMRAFKEIWMIAHRQLTMPQLLAWGREEGIDLKKMWGNDTSKPMPMGRDADPHDVAKVYRFWLALSKLRDNPMLVSPWEIVDTMKTRSLKDIGVLSCDVRLEQTDAYQWAEAEFRLSADRVIPGTIKQVL